MFDSGGIAGKPRRFMRRGCCRGDLFGHIRSGGVEALMEAVPVSDQLDLVVCLLGERMDRSGEFAADNAVSMASWLRSRARSSHGWASERVLAGRGLADRVIPPSMRTALNLRDQGCAAPACDWPLCGTDAHHVLSWLEGGITAMINLVLLCRNTTSRSTRANSTSTPS